MIKTKVVEANMVDGRLEEKELGYCYLPEVPVEKKPPPQLRQGEMPPTPLTIVVNGEQFWVIGHTWDVKLSAIPHDVEVINDTTLVLIVQRVPVMPSGLVRADENTMRQVEGLIPPPGGRVNGH